LVFVCLFFCLFYLFIYLFIMAACRGISVYFSVSFFPLVTHSQCSMFEFPFSVYPSPCLEKIKEKRKKKRKKKKRKKNPFSLSTISMYIQENLQIIAF